MVRFIYSWDDFDVFRKVPANMPKPDILKTFLRKPIVDTPDTFGRHKSYAEHNEKEVEDSIHKVGIKPEFLYQAKKYRSGEYADEIKHALENNETIKNVLDRYREKPLEENWLPISLFCPKCGKDTITELRWLGKYKISYACECGQKEELDFKKNPLSVKLKWRVDWYRCAGRMKKLTLSLAEKTIRRSAEVMIPGSISPNKCGTLMRPAT